MSEPTLSDYQRWHKMKDQRKMTCTKCGDWFFGTMFEDECPQCIWEPFYEALEVLSEKKIVD